MYSLLSTILYLLFLFATPLERSCHRCHSLVNGTRIHLISFLLLPSVYLKSSSYFVFFFLLFGCFCCRLERLLFNTIHTKCFSGWFLIILNAFFHSRLAKAILFALPLIAPRHNRAAHFNGTLVSYGFFRLQLFRFLVRFFAVGLCVHSFTLNVYVNSMRY